MNEITPPGRDLVVAMTLCCRAGMWSRLDGARRLQQKSPNAFAVQISRLQSSHQLIGDNCRQDCCSALGTRQRGDRDDRFGNQESGTLLPLQCFNHFTSYEILHDISQPYFISLVSIASIATASGQAPLCGTRTPTGRWKNMTIRLRLFTGWTRHRE